MRSAHPPLSRQLAAPVAHKLQLWSNPVDHRHQRNCQERPFDDRAAHANSRTVNLFAPVERASAPAGRWVLLRAQKAMKPCAKPIGTTLSVHSKVYSRRATLHPQTSKSTHLPTRRSATDQPSARVNRHTKPTNIISTVATTRTTTALTNARHDTRTHRKQTQFLCFLICARQKEGAHDFYSSCRSRWYATGSW